MLDFSALERPELEQTAVGLGLPAFRGRQIFQWIHQRGVSSFAEMTSLSNDLRAHLTARAIIPEPALDTRQISADGTTKFLLRLDDDRVTLVGSSAAETATAGDGTSERMASRSAARGAKTP